MTFKHNLMPVPETKPGLMVSVEKQSRWLDQIKTSEAILEHFKDNLALILGDEVGMGKTWIGLLTALSVAKSSPVLILVPNKVLANQWLEQLRDLLKMRFPDHERQKIVSSIRIHEKYEDFKDLLRDARELRRGIYITTFNAIDPRDPHNSYARIMENRSFFDLLVIDEGHKFKNSFTERYQIFENTKGSEYREPLKGRFKRLLIMTATPFQLNHQDLEVILGIAHSTSGEKELKERLSNQILKLIDSLNDYKIQLNDFEKKFQKIESVSLVNEVESLVLKKSLKGSNLSKDAAQCFEKLVEQKDVLNKAMRSCIIRNTKCKKKRKSIPWPLKIDDNSKLTFFLGDSFQRAKLRDGGTAHQVALLTSSFGRFDEFIEKSVSDLAQIHYSNLVRDIRKQAFADDKHPKIDEIIEHAFQNWINGDKTLIFAFYIKTVKEINSKLEEKISAHIRALREGFEEKELFSFLKSIGSSESRNSLVFRDNPFRISLLPLLKESMTSEEIEEFIKLDESDRDTLIRFLAKIKYPLKDQNYLKLLTSLCHVYFGKYKRKKKRAHIPADLEDDFETFIDPEATYFKNLFSRHVTMGEPEEETKRLGAIEDNVNRVIGDINSIRSIIFHPTIWEFYKTHLEEIGIEKRLNLTEVVWSYLTTDEFIFMDLLRNSESLPSIEEIPEIFKTVDLGFRENTYSRIQRFMISAGQIDEKNLENLVGDIAYRYQPNKRNAGKMIVETVSGENSSDEKHRSVIAFKTPLPPYALISTSVLAEGVDLHTECSDIIHYDHEWNPANLEQKIGRLDRVGSKGERLGQIDIRYPYLVGTQDQKAFNIVMGRKSWFGAVMGERYEDKWKALGDSNSLPLPESLQEMLVMELGITKR